MALCGASLKVFALAADCPGSWHDSRVFEESELFHLLNSGRYLPFENAVILADSAYKVCILGKIDHSISFRLLIFLNPLGMA